MSPQRVLGRLSRLLARGRQRLRRAITALPRVLPGRAMGAVEWPAEASTTVVTVHGWAYRRRDSVVAVVVLLDGHPAALATLGLPRPDVARVHRGADRSGWSATVDLRSVARGTAALAALVVTRAGLVERLDDFTIDAPPHPLRVGRITTPRDGGAVAPGPVILRGFAVPDTTPARINVLVDGKPAGRARLLAVPQPDVADASSMPWAPLAGFEHVLDLSGHRDAGRVRVDVAVVTLDGERASLSPVDLDITAPPAAPAVAPEVTAIAARVSAVADAGPSQRGIAAVRLLVVTHQLDLGGGQMYMFELLRRLLIELDISCLVVSTCDGVLRQELEELGAFVHVCEPPPMTAPEAYESLLLELAELVTSHDCNVAFVNTMSAAFGADLAERLRIPFVWAVHESYRLEEFFLAAYGHDGIHPYIKARATAALAAAAAVVFEADATRKLYASNGDPRRFVTIPYGIPMAELDAYRARSDRAGLRKAQGFAERETVLLCMGTYEPRKGQGALATAFGQVAAEFPDATLVMVGDTGGTYANAVREVVERLGLGQRIRLLPVVEDVYAWYAMADAFVTVSDVESLPRSVLEVMAFVVPVLAVNVFGLPELLEDGVTGLLCEQRDLAAIVHGLRRMLGASAAQRTSLGAAGADLVRARYDSSGYASAYRRLLRGLIVDPHSLPGELLS